jgi:hypothetical protein
MVVHRDFRVIVCLFICSNSGLAFTLYFIVVQYGELYFHLMML